MTIVSQNYNNMITNLIINEISKATINIKINSINNVFNYFNIIKSFDNIVNKSIILAIRSYLEELDLNYTNSLDRKNKYHIKDYCSRTILTIFGEITFKRHFFKSKLDGKSFCYVDRQLGLKKYQYFDPYIQSLVLEKASEDSISKACREINELIGNRVSLDKKVQFLSRQSARNIILNSILSEEEDTELNTPEELYIIADEKWISTQRKKDGSKHKKNDHDKKVMTKSIVIFDGYNKDGKRRYLKNKKVFASPTKNIIYESLDYIYNVYDINKIKRVFVMGDGAKWIKDLPPYYKFSKNTEVIFCLDKFHLKQALHHLAMSESYEQYLLKFILENNKKSFNILVNFIKNNNPKREDIINRKNEYIISNWKQIQNLYKYKMSCPMESQISHNIAYLTSSRPKGYSHKMLDKILDLRLKNINKQNIKKLFFNNFNSTEIKNISIEYLNFDIFDKYKQFIPIYEDKLFTPNIIRYI
jgi:hypothetical protein